MNGIDQFCSQTGQSLATLKKVIIHQWKMLVQQSIASSGHGESIILQDDIINILDELEDFLNSFNADEREMGNRLAYIRGHSQSRYSIGDLLTECSLLRETLINYLYPMGDQECAKVIHKYIDTITRLSVEDYFHDQFIDHSVINELRYE